MGGIGVIGSREFFMGENQNFIKPRGDYRTLLSYQKAEIIYDITFRFCERFLKRGDRTIDQMVQAARSGKQNIAEGSKAAPTSREMEIKLTNVARASLEELLIDYEDYLRVRDHKKWGKDSEEATALRKYAADKFHNSYESYRGFLETRPPETIANIAICLIHQANYLLDKQVASQGKDFANEGGFRERLSKVRREVRDKSNKNYGNNNDSPHNSH